MKPKFGTGDKVFAKVRGYPPWPARVEGLADETPNKMKYHIYFYGTGETAIVKAEDICTFVDNKIRLGKPKKHKNFTEALLQIEADLSPEEQETLAKLEEDSKNQSGVTNDSLVDDPSKRSSVGNKSKSSLSPTPKAKPKDKKRKLDNDSGSEDPDQKKRLSTVSNSDTESSAKSAEVLSRSGRKIKPKRFADFEDESSEDLPTSVKPINKVPPLKKSSDKENEEVLTDLIACVNGQKIKIPLNLNKPNFTKASDEEEWDEKVSAHAHQLKKQLEAGESLPVSVEAHMDQWTKDLAGKAEKSVTHKADESIRNEHLKTEATLLELDLNIRSALNIKKADTEKCIFYLDRLRDLKLTALMLKKHPDVVTTMKKVRRYIGNVPKAMSEEDERKFHKDAEIIRNKAEHIYNKFQNLFLVPSHRTFWDFFEEERERFDQNTKHMDSEEIVSLYEEPNV